MNWLPHLRSLERVITLLAIVGFIAGGAFLFVSYSGGPTFERGFLTVRHWPHTPLPAVSKEAFPRARPSATVPPNTIGGPIMRDTGVNP